MGGFRRQLKQNGGGAAAFAAALAVFLLAVGLFAAIFSGYGRSAFLDLDEEFYFLVKDCEAATASAVAGQVYHSGGAGYYFEADDGEFVALSCYYSREDAERVRKTLEERGEEVKIVSLGTKGFPIRDGSQTEEIRSAIKTAETCARLCYDVANGLEETRLGQSEAKAALCGVTKALKGLRGQTDFSRWNDALYAVQKRGEELGNGILFAKDLRCLQIELTLCILGAEEYFI